MLNPPSAAGDPVLPRVRRQGLHVVQVVVDGLQWPPGGLALLALLGAQEPRPDGLVHRARVQNAAADTQALSAVVVA